METTLETRIPLLAQLVYGTYSEQRTKKRLNHEEGIGSPCLRCGHGCSGLELHFWRKVCKNCGCKFEDHCVKVDEGIQEGIVHNYLEDDDVGSSIECSTDDEVIEGHPLLEHLSKKKRAKSRNKMEMHEVWSKSVSTDKTETDEFREQRLNFQIPPQDFDGKYCHDLDEYEREELSYFTLQVQNNVIGKATKRCKIPKNGNVMRCIHCTNVIDGNYLCAELLQDKSWHSDCFRCHTCQDNLVDNIYFVDHGNIYCGRHYAEIYKPRCQACDELIFSKEYTEAEGKSWHTKHFCCYLCEMHLGGDSYVIIKSIPHCVACYHGKVADRCLKCARPILADGERICCEQTSWHLSCFVCSACQTCLIDRKFFQRGDTVYCSVECGNRV